MLLLLLLLLLNFQIESTILINFKYSTVLLFCIVIVIVKENIGQHIRQIMLKMLDLIRDTENDDVSNAIQNLIYVFEDEISTFAIEITQHLVRNYSLLAAKFLFLFILFFSFLFNPKTFV
jgi:hypothetical protein